MPNIAIIGKQNVGKSTLFNRLIGKPEAITTSQAGSTRDIIQHELDWGEGTWRIADFPGFEDKKYLQKDELTQAAVQKSLGSLKEYHLLLWLVSRHGLTAFEHELHNDLRQLDQIYWLVVNFVDDPSLEPEASGFYRLGAVETFFISALNYRNINKLNSNIKKYFSAKKITIQEKDNAQTSRPPEIAPKIAIIGKTNAGKSTLFNFLLQKERSLVSILPGTTRDSLSLNFCFYKKPFTIIDTAGLRKNKTGLKKIDKLSEEKTLRSIRRANIIFLLIDPMEGFDRQIQNMMRILQKHNKPVIISINKYDIICKEPEKKENLFLEVSRLEKKFWKFPTYFISAQKGDNVVKLLKSGIELIEKSNIRYKTPVLNKFLQTLKKTGTLRSKQINPLYLIQKGDQTDFILYANRKFHSAQTEAQISRFIAHRLQDFLKIEDIPVCLRIINTHKN